MATRTRSPLKKLLTTGRLWWRYYNANIDTLRPVEIQTITRILACGTSIMGYATFDCPNPHCTHKKRICFGCHSRFCNTCGKKGTDQWIENQKALLPLTRYQHITYTMPSVLWPLFKLNRHLLGQLSALAAQTVLNTAKKKGVTPGLFTALHTFGRDLKWNTHIHLSTTLGGLTHDNTQWKKLYYPKASIMSQWRYAVISCLREAYKAGELTLPPPIENDQHWNAFLDAQYRKSWIVHFSKPTANPQHTIGYLGRYVTRPPLAMSRLKHYDGSTVVFQYLDHKTKTRRRYACKAMAFIERFIQHIPDKGFRLIRCYGFLANRVRSVRLPIVYTLLKQSVWAPRQIRFPALLKASFGLDPLRCILCQASLVFSGITRGKALWEIYNLHDRLAQNRI